MQAKNVLYDKSDGVGTITLNRHAKSNALNYDIMDELWALLQDIIVDDDVRVVVLTAAGKYFSAGADMEVLTTLATSSLATIRRQIRTCWQRIFNEFEDMQKLTIAAVNGSAIGGGVELALSCDLRYSVDDATFSLPEVNFGIIPEVGGVTRLPWLIGLAKAKELILSGESIGAKEAEELGLVNKIFPRETFKEEVRKLALKFAQKPPLALGIGKQLINRSFQLRDAKFSLEDAIDVQSILIHTEDYQEAVAALKEKRAPIFRGR